MGKRMDPGFAVFNLHVNDAGARADAEFVAQFGQDAFDTEIAPLHEAGIMSIFSLRPTPRTAAWVALVTAFVNEDHETSTTSRQAPPNVVH